MNRNTCKGRNKRHNPKVCLGWTQEWTSPRRVARNKHLNVREIVRGPFSSPKLIKTQPFVSCLPDQQFRTVGDDCCTVRRGIPDAWREYLACQGLCGTAEITVLQKNLIPSCIRSVATDRLWNEVGLPLVQGIPDPWKSKPIRRCKTSKYLRQQRFRNKYLCPRTGCVYDGDDEAEIERGAECQLNKKGPPQKKHTKLDSTERESPSKGDKKDDLIIIKDPNTHVASSKLARPGQNRKRKSDNAEKKKDSTKVESRQTVRRIPGKVYLHDTKTLSKKREVVSNVKKQIQTDVVKKTSAAVQTNSAVKPRIEEVQDPPPRRDLEINATLNSTLLHTVCCNCLLQNYMTYLSGFSNRLKNPANHVLCKNCEDAYYKEQQCKIQAGTTGRFCTPDPRTYPKRATIYEWTKLKFCDCVQKARDRFGTDRPSRCNVKTKRTLLSKKEMKLICYRCDSPYLRLQNIHAKTVRRKKCSCKGKKPRTEYQRPVDSSLKTSTARKRRRSISCSSRRCGLNIGSKGCEPDVEQSSIVTYKSNVAKDKRDDYKLDVQALCENIRQKEDKGEESRVGDKVETYIAPPHQMDSNITLLYRISDSGEDADISEYISNNFDVTLQIPRVTSLTYIQKVRDAALNKLRIKNPRQLRNLSENSSLDGYVHK